MMPVRTNASTLSIKKKNATIRELRVSFDMLMLYALRYVDAREDICQQVCFVDQHWQALCADIIFFPFECQSKQGCLFIASFTVRAVFCYLVVHNAPEYGFQRVGIVLRDLRGFF